MQAWWSSSLSIKLLHQMFPRVGTMLSLFLIYVWIVRSFGCLWYCWSWNFKGQISPSFGYQRSIAWLRSAYLLERLKLSEFSILITNVLHSSLLGTMLYNMYTTSFTKVIKQHNVVYHFNADDAQILVAVHRLVQNSYSKSRIEQCIGDIEKGMTTSKLKSKSNKNKRSS